MVLYLTIARATEASTPTPKEIPWMIRPLWPNSRDSRMWIRVVSVTARNKSCVTIQRYLNTA